MSECQNDTPSIDRLRQQARLLRAQPRATRILAPGSNCWRVTRAQRIAWLVDGEAYFHALRETLKRAQRSVFVIAWDIDSRTALLPDDPGDGWPILLGEFLHQALARNPALHVRVLDWDYAMLYVAFRELPPPYATGWRRHRRLHIAFDGEHPIGGSQHQKIVVVDDRVAFVGGMDVTSARWDTTEHLTQDPRRTRPRGGPYSPFHDIQMMVDGETAQALGQLARARWVHSTGRRVGAPPLGEDPWPLTVAPDLRHAPVGIARTQPEYGGNSQIQEIKQLYLDAIAAARSTIYIENQYLTAPAVIQALAARLAQADGPEVVILSRLHGGGWLEESTMTALRMNAVNALRDADTHARLRVVYPHADGLGDACIDLHSKLMIVDDRFARIGSANLNNRSMGYDTECDLAVEATEPRIGTQVLQLRHRLVAEHLGVTPQEVARACERTGSLIGAIDSLHGNRRDLLELDVPRSPEPVLFDPALMDPERPVEPELLATQLVPAGTRRRTVRHLVAGAALLLAIAALAAAWRWTPLAAWVDMPRLAGFVQALRDAPLAPLWILALYVAASCLAIPITLLIFSTAMVFGSLDALFYALAGSLLGAAFTFELGQLLGRDLVRRIAGPRLTRLNHRLQRRGLLAMVTLRLLPIAPFTVVNLAAGASQIRRRHFLLGTLIGMLPGIVAITLFTDRVLAAVRQPSALTLAALAAALAAIGVGIYALRTWLARWRSPGAGSR
jgi:phosphatidylserine/phosphatidylglycerophosphate/cardiolipin synthase-like enzyme/uncharacterized membrane protein YdjX (TVP38/TMEM64 family)